MRSYTILLVIIVINALASRSAYSQTNDFNLRIAPLSLLDIYSGSCYKIGVEFKIFGNNSLTLEGGGYFRNFNGMTNVKGHILDFGIRHYLSEKLDNNGMYISMNCSYKDQSFDYSDTIKATPRYLKEYNIHKYVTCVNMNIGYSSVSRERIVIDYYGGLGFRLKTVNSTLTPEELDKAIEYNDSQSLFFMVTPGQFIWPNINLGLRIGYIIK